MRRRGYRLGRFEQLVDPLWRVGSGSTPSTASSVELLKRGSINTGALLSMRTSRQGRRTTTARSIPATASATTTRPRIRTQQVRALPAASAQYSPLSPRSSPRAIRATTTTCRRAARMRPGSCRPRSAGVIPHPIKPALRDCLQAGVPSMRVHTRIAEDRDAIAPRRCRWDPGELR